MPVCNYTCGFATRTSPQDFYRFVGAHEIVVYASACMLRNKMTCAMKFDYSEEEVRSVNLHCSSSPNFGQRQDTGQDIWSWVWIQWITVTSLMPYHALHVPQHVAVSLFEPLNQMISFPPSTETVFCRVRFRHFWKQNIT